MGRNVSMNKDEIKKYVHNHDVIIRNMSIKW